MINNNSIFQAQTSSFAEFKEQVSEAAKLAQEILLMEGIPISSQLKNLVGRLSEKGNVEDLKAIKICLTHLHQFEKFEVLVPALVQLIRVNKRGKSNIESIRFPLLNMVNKENCKALIELAKEPVSLIKWLQFSITGRNIKMDKISSDLLKKFLNSKICRYHSIDWEKMSTKQDCMTFYSNENKLELKFYGQMLDLFDDEDLMELVVDFNLKYPKAAVPLLIWMGADIAATKQVLIAALSCPLKAEVLSKLFLINTTSTLSTLSTLFSHSSLSQKELLKLNSLLDCYPAHADCLVFLFSFAMDHQELKDKIFRLLSSHKNITKQLDFLSQFSNLEKEQLFLSFFDLLKITEENQLNINWKNWGELPKDVLVKLIKKMGELSKEQLDIVKMVIHHQKIDFFYWAIPAGFLDDSELKCEKMRSIYDWYKSHPQEYEMIVKICHVASNLGLKMYNQFGVSLWMFMKYFPEDLSNIVSFAQGNAHVAIGYINAAMEELKFTELEEIKEVVKNEKNGQNDKDSTSYRRIYYHLKKLGFLSFKEKRRVNALMYGSREVLANRILNLFYRERSLASILLEIAVDQQQTQLAEQILDKINLNPDSLFSQTLRKLAPLEDLNGIVDLYSLQLLIEKTAIAQERQCYEKIMETINNQPSKENLLTLFKTLRKDELSIKKEVSSLSDLAAITKIDEELHTFGMNEYDVHSLLLNKLIIKISSLIIENDGQINFQMIDSILDVIDRESLPVKTSYLNHIKFILNELKCNQNLIDDFIHLVPTKDIPPSGAFIIRATAGLAFDAPITAKALKVAALSALLTYERQPPDVGSCVGASRLSYMLKHPAKCIKFISEMLLTGGVSMNVSANKQTFVRCQSKPSDYFLQKHALTFSKNKEGRAIQEDCIFPAIHKLADFFSIPKSQIKEWVQNALDKGNFINRNLERTQYLSVSHREFIKALVHAENMPVSKFEMPIDQLIDLAETVYLSAIENLPSRSLEGLFVSADADEIERIHWAIFTPLETLNQADMPDSKNQRLQIFNFQCKNGEKSPCAIPKTLISAWQALFKIEGLKEASNWFLEALKKHIHTHFDLVYDPSATDFEGNRSCRILMDATLPFEGRPAAINTPDLFLKQCADICQKVMTNFESYLETSKLGSDGDVRDKWQNLKQELIAYMGSERYAKGVSLLFSYLPEDISETVTKEKALDYDPFFQSKAVLGKMPWLLQSGANNMASWNLVSSKGEKNQLLKLNLICRKPEDIFSLIESMRGIHDLTLPAYQRYAGSMPGHAINFDFSHPSLKGFIQCESPKEWLQSNCIEPAMKIAKEIFVKQSDFERIRSTIKMELPRPLRDAWKRLTTCYFEGESSICNVRDFLFSRLQMCLGTEEEIIPAAFNQLEEGLFKLIPQKIRSQLPMLPVIDTNWIDVDEMKDLYFALYFNPASAKWEMWKVDSKLQYSKKTANHQWFKCQDFYSAFFIA